MLLAAAVCFVLSYAGGYYYAQLDPVGKKEFIGGLVIGAITTFGIAKLITNSIQ